jgi:hypothetical protein
VLGGAGIVARLLADLAGDLSAICRPPILLTLQAGTRRRDRFIEARRKAAVVNYKDLFGHIH